MHPLLLPFCHHDFYTVAGSQMFREAAGLWQHFLSARVGPGRESLRRYEEFSCLQGSKSSPNFGVVASLDTKETDFR
jgi:hypothetical protein